MCISFSLSRQASGPQRVAQLLRRSLPLLSKISHPRDKSTQDIKDQAHLTNVASLLAQLLCYTVASSTRGVPYTSGKLENKPNKEHTYGVSQNYGYLFEGPHNKDYSILGSILGSPYFGKLPYTHIITRLKSCLRVTRQTYCSMTPYSIGE